MNLVTMFDWSYRVKGLALYDSLARHTKDFHLHILALDENTWDFLVKRNLKNVTVIKLESIETQQLLDIKQKRSWAEYVFTLTPSLTYSVLCHHNLAELAYLDSDVFFFSDPTPLYEEVENSEIAIVPHRFAEKDLGHLPAGKYNVGWVYFKNTPGARKCLMQWRDQCLDWCGTKTQNGKYADQKYWDALVPQYGVHSVKQLGSDVAPWNNEQYSYTSKNGKIYVDGEPLVFFHFHELEHDTNGNITKYTNWELHPDVKKLVYPVYENTLREVSLWK